MKTLKILPLSDMTNHQVTTIKTGAGKILKSILFIFMLFYITLLSSCMFPGPGRERHQGNERHGNNERHGDNERHDNGEHRGNDDHRDK
jgi:hypothetical protein